MSIQERSPRIAGVHGSIGLDDRFHFPAVHPAGERPVQIRDDAGGQRTLKAERVSQSVNALPDPQVIRLADRDWEKLVGRRLDFEHGDVLSGIGTYQLRRIALATW